MRRILSASVLFFAFSLSYGQYYITLKDGNQIRAINFKDRKDSLLVSIEGRKEKQKISIKEVTAYYSLLDYVIKFIKPSTLPQSLNFNGHQFVERLYPGRINLYYRKESGGSHTYGNYYFYEYYYIEKEDRFERLYFPDLLGLNKLKQIDFLKTFVNDHEPSLKKLDDNFSFTNSSILDFIRGYNLAMYEPHTPRDTLHLCEIIIYRRDKNKKNAPVKITLDQQEFLLDNNDFIKAKIDYEAISKICIGNGENLTCELFKGHPYFQIYYEIRVDSKVKSTFELKDKKWAEFYLKSMKNWKSLSNRKN